MKRIEAKRYNGQWRNRGVLSRLRQKLKGAIAQGECVLLDGEDVVGLEAEDLKALIAGLPEDKIKLAGFHPLPRPLPKDHPRQNG